jgi:hypothetical protein
MHGVRVTSQNFLAIKQNTLKNFMHTRFWPELSGRIEPIKVAATTKPRSVKMGFVHKMHEWELKIRLMKPHRPTGAGYQWDRAPYGSLRFAW